MRNNYVRELIFDLIGSFVVSILFIMSILWIIKQFGVESFYINGNVSMTNDALSGVMVFLAFLIFFFIRSRKSLNSDMLKIQSIIKEQKHDDKLVIELIFSSSIKYKMYKKVCKYLEERGEFDILNSIKSLKKNYVNSKLWRKVIFFDLLKSISIGIASIFVCSFLFKNKIIDIQAVIGEHYQIGLLIVLFIALLSSFLTFKFIRRNI